MRKVFGGFIFLMSLVVIYPSYAALDLNMKLNKINFQIERAKIFAANCVTEPPKPQTTNENCSQATDILQKMNQKVITLEKLNSTNNGDITDNIKQLRTKMDQLTQEITDANFMTGNTKLNSPLKPASN